MFNQSGRDCRTDLQFQVCFISSLLGLIALAFLLKFRVSVLKQQKNSLSLSNKLLVWNCLFLSHCYQRGSPVLCFAVSNFIISDLNIFFFTCQKECTLINGMFYFSKEITLQQIMAHLDSIRKDMVILEKSEFANLRAENEVLMHIFIQQFSCSVCCILPDVQFCGTKCKCKSNSR